LDKQKVKHFKVGYVTEGAGSVKVLKNVEVTEV
jgi:hypothetical protein